MAVRIKSKLPAISQHFWRIVSGSLSWTGRDILYMSLPATLLMIFQIGTAAFGSIKKGSCLRESSKVNCRLPISPFIPSSLASSFSSTFSYYAGSFISELCAMSALSLIIKGDYCSYASSFLLDRISDMEIILYLRSAWSRPDSFTDLTVSNLFLILLAAVLVGVTSSCYFKSPFNSDLSLSCMLNIGGSCGI